MKVKLTKRERRGALVLVAFVLLFLVVQVFVPTQSSSRFKIAIEKPVTDSQLVEAEKKNEGLKHTPPLVVEEIEEISLKDTAININTVGIFDLKQVGFTEGEAKRIVNYRKSLGRFNDFNHFASIYSLSEQKRSWLIKYGIIEKLELNSATVSDFKSFSGIGNKLANRIVSYREKLGGFIQVTQLYEVYGLDTLVVDQIAPYFMRKSEVSKINVNLASLEELMRHPYVDYRLAMELIKQRSQVPLKSLDFLQASYSSEFLDKTAQYFSYE